MKKTINYTIAKILNEKNIFRKKLDWKEIECLDNALNMKEISNHSPGLQSKYKLWSDS